MTSSTKPYDGGCACGHVRYRMTADPLFVNCCHCRSCQRQTGAAFALNAMVEADCVQRLEGEVELVEVPTDSGKGQKIARCPKCRVALWGHYNGAGDAISFVRVGTLDEPDRLPPGMHIYIESKQPWVTLGSEIPSTVGFYNPAEAWSKESLERYGAAQARSK